MKIKELKDVLNDFDESDEVELYDIARNTFCSIVSPVKNLSNNRLLLRFSEVIPDYDCEICFDKKR